MQQQQQQQQHASNYDAGATASSPHAPIKLSRSKLHTLQAQLTNCHQLLSSSTATTSATASQTLITSLTTFLSNLLTLDTELAPHTTTTTSATTQLSFDHIATTLLPGIQDTLCNALQSTTILNSTALPLLLQCIPLFPLPTATTAAQQPDRLRLLCSISGGSIQQLAMDIAHEQVYGVCMSATTVTARLSPLSASSLILFSQYVRHWLTEATAAEVVADSGGLLSVLVLMVQCSQQLLSGMGCGGVAVLTDLLSIYLKRSPSFTILPLISTQLLLLAGSYSGSDRMEAYVTLCENKAWVDWSLFTLVLPALYHPQSANTADIRQQLLRLLSFFYSFSTATTTATAGVVHDWIDRVQRITTQHSSLSALYAALSTTGLLTSAPSHELCLQLLICFIPLYAPMKDEVSGFLSSLLSLFGGSGMTLSVLLYHLLSQIGVFVSTAPYFVDRSATTVTAGVSGTAFVVSLRSASECWAYSLTCETSVPALKRQGVEEGQEKRIRECTRHVLNELRQLAVAGSVR